MIIKEENEQNYKKIKRIPQNELGIIIETTNIQTRFIPTKQGWIRQCFKPLEYGASKIKNHRKNNGINIIIHLLTALEGTRI